MRLALASTGEGADGAIERHLLSLVDHALANSWQVAVIARPGSYLDAASHRGAEAIEAAFSSASDARSLAKTARAIRSFRPHVLHAHDPRSLWMCFWASRMTKTRLLVSDHNSSTAKTESGFFAEAGGWRPIQPGLGRILNRIDRVVATSDSCRRDLQQRLGVDPTKIETIFGGTTRPATSYEVEPQTVGMVSRLSQEKGADVAIRAVAHMRGARLKIAGAGPQRAELDALISDLGVADRVELLGWVDDPSRLLGAAACVCVPSRWDNAPLVVMDAMRAGKPIVASAVGAIPELLTHGETGILVDKEDPVALAAAIEGVIGDASLQHRLGDAARQDADRRFTVERVWDDHHRLYERTVDASTAA
jgi:glycosyltransferase involved in cell wall biosynthesis